MNIGALSLAQTPPLSVPLRYFLTAPPLLALAALLALWEGPSLLASRWMPSLLAVTHLVTLGFATMVMLGAIQQVLPVLAGAPLRRPTLTAGLVHLPLLAGTLALAAGFQFGARGLMRAALVLLALASFIFLAAAVGALLRARSAHATVTALSAALAALLATVGFGLHLLAGYAFPGLGVARHFTDLHLTWGLVGWIALLVFAVAYQVVPMFQITPDYPRRMQARLAPALFLLLVVWSAAEGLLRRGSHSEPWLPWLPAAGIIGLLGWFAITTLHLQRQRRRRLPDVTVDHFRVAMIALLVAPLPWLARPLLPEWAPFLELLAASLLLLGFGVSVMTGMLYKIVPFLVWLHLNNRLQAGGQWQGQIPNMKQVIPERAARLQWRLQLLALAAWSGACLWPVELLRPAAALWFCNALLLGWNLLGAVRLYRRTLVGAGG